MKQLSITVECLQCSYKIKLSLMENKLFTSKCEKCKLIYSISLLPGTFWLYLVFANFDSKDLTIGYANVHNLSSSINDSNIQSIYYQIKVFI